MHGFSEASTMEPSGGILAEPENQKSTIERPLRFPSLSVLSFGPHLYLNSHHAFNCGKQIKKDTKSITSDPSDPESFPVPEFLRGQTRSHRTGRRCPHPQTNHPPRKETHRQRWCPRPFPLRLRRHRRAPPR